MGNYKMKFIVTKLIYLLIFIVGLSVFAEETSLEGAYIWTLKYPDGNETVEKIYFKNKNASSPEFVGEIRFREFAKLVI